MFVYEKKLNIQGFTLIELMVTVAIAGILMSVGLPSFNQTISNGRLTSNINKLVTAFNYARSEAVKRNQSVTVIKIGGGTGNWTGGWKVFLDLNGNGAKDDANDTLLKQYEAMPTGYTLRASNINYVTYKASGMSGAGSFVLCDNGDGNNLPETGTSKVMLINTVGRVGMGADADNNGIQEIGGTEITHCVTSPFTS